MNEKVKNKIENSKDSGFGQYKESTGGGTPMGKGQKKYSIGGRGTWQDNYQKEPHREEGQPRTDDGKFTYNAVNGKELKDISKVDGHSRGTTIPPTLTGGENGKHYYTDKKHSAFKKDAEELRKYYEDKYGTNIWRAGEKYATFDGHIKVTETDAIDCAMEYGYLKTEQGEIIKGHIGGAKKGAKSLEDGEGMEEGTKIGRRRESEKAALNAAESLGANVRVDDEQTEKGYAGSLRKSEKKADEEEAWNRVDHEKDYDKERVSDEELDGLAEKDSFSKRNSWLKDGWRDDLEDIRGEKEEENDSDIEDGLDEDIDEEENDNQDIERKEPETPAKEEPKEKELTEREKNDLFGIEESDLDMLYRDENKFYDDNEENIKEILGALRKIEGWEDAKADDLFEFMKDNKLSLDDARKEVGL